MFLGGRGRIGARSPARQLSPGARGPRANLARSTPRRPRGPRFLDMRTSSVRWAVAPPPFLDMRTPSVR